MNFEQRMKYTKDRKLHSDYIKEMEQIASLRKVILHNAYKTEEIDSLLKSVGIEAEMYFPKNMYSYRVRKC